MQSKTNIIPILKFSRDTTNKFTNIYVIYVLVNIKKSPLSTFPKALSKILELMCGMPQVKIITDKRRKIAEFSTFCCEDVFNR